jgi:hypothetical protein
MAGLKCAANPCDAPPPPDKMMTRAEATAEAKTTRRLWQMRHGNWHMRGYAPGPDSHPGRYCGSTGNHLAYTCGVNHHGMGENNCPAVRVRCPELGASLLYPDDGELRPRLWHMRHEEQP